MSKKTKKNKAAKKPVKKTKKASSKKAVKKSAPKKTAKKPAKKKIVAKKAVKKKVKKLVAKKQVKKIVAKKPAKKTVAKKQLKKVKAKNPQTKKEIKAVDIKALQPPLQVETKIKEEPVKPAKTKKEEAIFDEENTENDEVSFQYEIPETFIKARSKYPQPKPFIPKKEDKRTRYSDKELGEFKAILIEKLEEAKKDYELLKATLTHKDDHGTDDTSPTFKLLEDGSDVLSKEETAQLAGRQEKFIQNLQNALIRIQNKTYGICRATGKLIPKERLYSVPHATLSIGAKLEGTY